MGDEDLGPLLVQAARHILAMNPGGERVEVVHADAFDYLPPEPVDVVICEMLHVGMLREKQIPVIDSFKQRYLEKFGEVTQCDVAGEKEGKSTGARNRKIVAQRPVRELAAAGDGYFSRR